MTASPMNSEHFWNIIDKSLLDSDPNTRMDTLKEILRKLTLEEIISFEVTFRSLLNKAYSWNLWGAAYVIHGGCSDDGFEYFRRWLISRGRIAYEAALNDPDSLAKLESEPFGLDGVWEFEEFYYVALEVFEEKGGEGDVRDYSEIEAGLDGTDPSGEPFEDDEEYLAKHYPNLWKRFEDSPPGEVKILNFFQKIIIKILKVIKK